MEKVKFNWTSISKFNMAHLEYFMDLKRERERKREREKERGEKFFFLSFWSNQMNISKVPQWLSSEITQDTLKCLVRKQFQFKSPNRRSIQVTDSLFNILKVNSSSKIYKRISRNRICFTCVTNVLNGKCKAFHFIPHLLTDH